MTVREMIKPSSPTPPHLRKHQLSYLDQLSPPVYVGIVLYYQSHDSGDTSLKLRRSLSDALAIYYPLAGRLRDDYTVDCNDAGAEYVEVRFSDVRIADVVDNPRTEELQQYLPVAPSGGRDIPLAVQVSFFGCSGLAIGVCISHRLSDATSLVAFANTWAAVCRGDAAALAATQPCFALASRFPPRDEISRPRRSPPPAATEKVVTTRLRFEAGKIEALKKEAAGAVVETPSRVEAVTVFIWSRFIEAVRRKDGKRSVAATHAVDARGRASPPLPANMFGNATVRVMATAAEEGERVDCRSLAVKLREVIRKGNGDYIRGFENGQKYKENEDPELEMCRFTSWSRLGYYEADYGWGKPVWASITGLPVKNLVILLGTQSMDGIDAYVSMVEEDVAVIESYYHLLH